MGGKKRCWTSRIKRDKEEEKGKSRDHAETSREKNKNPDDFSPIEYFAWRNERREEFIPPTEGTIRNCPIEAKEKWGEFHGVEIKRMEKQKEPFHTFPTLIEATANFILAFQEKYPFNTINSWNCPPMRWLNYSRSNLLSFSLTTDGCVEDSAECSDFPHREEGKQIKINSIKRTRQKEVADPFSSFLSEVTPKQPWIYSSAFFFRHIFCPN